MKIHRKLPSRHCNVSLQWTWCINTRTRTSGLATYLPLFVNGRTWQGRALLRGLPAPVPVCSVCRASQCRAVVRGLLCVRADRVDCYIGNMPQTWASTTRLHKGLSQLEHSKLCHRGNLTKPIYYIHACVNCDTVGHTSGQTPHGRLCTLNLGQTASVSAHSLVFLCTLTFPHSFLYRPSSVHRCTRLFVVPAALCNMNVPGRSSPITTRTLSCCSSTVAPSL
jgi:hypothetical protein